jgi:hypothetical protein
MKKQLLILALSLIAFFSYSQRVMTAQEKETLRNDPVFKFKCEWAIQEIAEFFSQDSYDGLSSTTLDQNILWAKNKAMGIAVWQNGIQFRKDDVVNIFLDAAKSKQYDLPGGDQDASVLLAEWVSENSYEEFVHKYYELWGEHWNMKRGGN